MRTIACLNLKGGVAKSTTVINLAAYLAKDGKKVLVVDADSQCNTTDFFMVNASYGNLASILTTRPVLIDEKDTRCIYTTDISGLDVLPAGDELMDLDLTAITNGLVFPTALRELLLMLDNLDDYAYDFVLIDCPPSFSAACSAALIAADEVLIPMKLDYFSISGMSNLMRQIQNMRKVNHRLRLLGVLPTMYRENEYTETALKQLAQAGIPVVHPYIPRSDKVDEMTFHGEPLSTYSPKSGPGRAYKLLARRLTGGAHHE